MKSQIFYWLLGLTLLGATVFALPYEKAGWIASDETKKMKNPIKAVNPSIQKGKH